MKKFDLSKPFLAIGDHEYFVNPLDVPITNVTFDSGGSVGPHSTGSSTETIGNIEPRAYAVIRTVDADVRGEYDETLRTWTFTYEVNGKNEGFHYRDRRLSDAEYVKSIPYVGGPGYVAPVGSGDWENDKDAAYSVAFAKLPDVVRFRVLAEGAGAGYAEPRPSNNSRV